MINQILEYKEHNQDFRFYEFIKPYVERYLSAVRKKDTSEIQYIAKFGNSVRQRIEGLREFDRAKLFGYTEDDIVLDEYGWLHFRLNKIKTIHFLNNSVNIGCSKYGIFSFGLNYSYGNGGGGWYASIWDKPFNNVDNCIYAGILELKKRLLNSNAQRTIKLIDNELNNQMQLKLF